LLSARVPARECKQEGQELRRFSLLKGEFLLISWPSVHRKMLVDRMVDGHPTQRVAMANRNGFFYLLDAKQTRAKLPV
jgi:hypothetical protein